MKKPTNVEDLAASLSAAASAPLVRLPEDPVLRQQPPARKKKESSIAVFLRVPGAIYARYDAEAVARTKATGKGVTVQQVILEKLGGDL